MFLKKNLEKNVFKKLQKYENEYLNQLNYDR